MIEWIHIMDMQPEDGRSIIQVDAPYQGHYAMGMRDYVQKCTFQQLLKFNADNNIPYPDFWWMYSDDFPFPNPR